MRLNKFVAVLLAALLMFSVLAIPAFAEETSSAVDSSAEVTSSGETSSATETGSSATSSATDPGATEKKELNWNGIIAGGVVLLAILVLVVLYFVNAGFHARANRFFKEYSSELRKVVWSPWRDVKKNTAIVIIFSAFFAIVIGVLDFVFSKGIIALKPLIQELFKL